MLMISDEAAQLVHLTGAADLPEQALLRIVSIRHRTACGWRVRDLVSHPPRHSDRDVCVVLAMQQDGE